MARVINRLSARAVKTLQKPGRHADGQGLYLSIDASGSRRRWVLIYRWREPGKAGPGKLKELGLGSARYVSLVQARELASQMRRLLAAGEDPKRAGPTGRSIPTFKVMAEGLINSLEPGWRNPKHRAQWRMTLREYCRPLHDIPVDKIDTDDVLAVLKPIWLRVPETASRVRGRIEKVLDAARAKGFRTGENPARWRGHLDHLLPRRQKLTRGHHKAVPYQEVPGLVRRLRELGSVSALCLEFTILTAARSGEAMGARWEEIDLGSRAWTVPAARMKTGEEHRVPLSARVVEIVMAMRKMAEGPFVFPGAKPDRPLSTMALAMVLRRLKVDATVHGFRSSFRDWAAEQSSMPREVAEAALAHALENKVEAAYFRSDLFEKRRQMMELWSGYLNGSEGARPNYARQEDQAGSNDRIPPIQEKSRLEKTLVPIRPTRIEC